MAFVGCDRGRLEMRLCVADPDGSHPRPVTPRWLYVSTPDWSPDGQRIAFTGIRWGRWHRGSREFLGIHIYLIDADGRNLRRLQPGSHPAWSPDRRTILYAVPYSLPRGDHAEGLHAMNPDGGHSRLLAPGARGPGWSREAAWSPDSRRIAFTARIGKEQMGIWIVDADGSHRRLLMRDSADLFGPVWLPEGILFTRQTYGEGDPTIWVIDAEGGHQRLLVRDAETNSGLAYVFCLFMGGA